MRVDMDQRSIAFYERTFEGSLKLLTRFECVQVTMLRPVLRVCGNQSISLFTRTESQIEGFRNIAKAHVTSSHMTISDLPPLQSCENVVVTSGNNFVSTSSSTAGAITAIDGYVSVVGAIGTKWTRGIIYYEVEIVELGGEGRGVLNPTRSANEGGQLTIGWATGDFRGEAYIYKGVGDDRHSWGLRAADPRPWSRWATGDMSGQKGPCFVHHGKPIAWRPNGEDIPRQPPDSNRIITSGDVLGCAYNIENGECHFFLMRQPGLLDDFEKESRKNRVLKYEDFHARCDDRQRKFKLIVPKIQDGETLSVPSAEESAAACKLLVPKLKAGSIFPAASLHPNAQIRCNFGERSFRILECLPSASAVAGPNVTAFALPGVMTGELAYSVLYASRRDEPRTLSQRVESRDLTDKEVAKALKQAAGGNKLHKRERLQFAEQILGLYELWTSPAEQDAREQLKDKFIFTPPKPLTFRKDNSR